MKGVFTLGIYVAIGIIPAFAGTAAFGQQPPPTYSPIPPSMMKAFATTNPLLEQLATQSAAKTAEIVQRLAAIPTLGASPIVPPSNPLTRSPIVISFGKGGRVDEHRQQFAVYQRAKSKVEIRGPCYSACTLVLAYVEPENLCIASGGFMAFHAIRSMEHGEIMVGATHEFYASMPAPIQLWIRDNGGWQNLPLNGYWTLYDRQMWAMGYPKCK
jgi:hypothetical protein